MDKEITEDMFDDYELVRQTGICNMMDIRRVMDLTGLTKPQCLAIMKGYTELREKFEGDSVQNTTGSAQ